MTKLTVYAMTDKGLAVVQRLLATHTGVIEQVIGARDTAITDDAYDRIASLCSSHGVVHCDRHAAPPVRSPWALAVSWRWLLHLPQTRLIVLHDSLLPRLRGFNPLVTALVNGDCEVGVTALLATEQMDRGDVVEQARTRIDYPITIAEAIRRIEPLYAELASSIVTKLAAGVDLEAYPQDESRATYSLWRDEQDYFINWHQDAATIRRFIDAVGTPYRGACARLSSRLVRILKAEALPDVRIENRVPGKVLFMVDGAPAVVCGQGMLKLQDLRDDTTGESLLPLKGLRLRFHNATPSTHH